MAKATYIQRLNEGIEKKSSKKLWVVFRFLVCVLLAFIYWIFEKSLNIDKFTFVIPVSYYNLPVKYQLAEPLPNKLTFKFMGKAGDFLSAQWMLNSETLKVDLSKHYQKKNIELKKETLLFKRKVRDYNLDLVEYTLRIPLSIREASISVVPVRSDLNVKIKEGFLEDKPVEFIPNSVTLVGDTSILNDFGGWYTINKEIELTGGADTFTIPLVSGLNMKVSPENVKAVFHTSKYTEMEVQKEISISDESQFLNGKLSIYPNKIKVKFVVPIFMVGNLSVFKNVKVSIDASQINKDAQWITPTVTGFPEYVRGIRCEPPYLQFLVTQN